jgi:phosphatidylglycerophosphate synthase
MDVVIGIILHIIQIKALHHNITTSQKPNTITFSKSPITLIVLCLFFIFLFSFFFTVLLTQTQQTINITQRQ